jgi:hypothetical protein
VPAPLAVLASGVAGHEAAAGATSITSHHLINQATGMNQSLWSELFPVIDEANPIYL